MDESAALRTTLAGFLGISPDALTSDFPLRTTKLGSSIQRAMLYAQLRSQAGLAVRGMPVFDTFGALEAQLLGRGAAAPASPSSAAAASAAASRTATPDAASLSARAATGDSPISCGIDIESVASLPTVPDYWEDAFYTSHFTREELAACLVQDKPRVHLAGRWCVKEALKKCDPAFLDVAMNQIELRADTAGAPTIWSLDGETRRRLPYAVSLSHTDDFAIGAVVRMSAAVAAAPAPPPPPPTATAPAALPPAPSRSLRANLTGILGMLFGLAGIALAAYAIWRGH